MIYKNGIRVNPRKIDPIINMSQPTNYYSKVHSKYGRHRETYKLIEKNAIWEWKNVITRF